MNGRDHVKAVRRYRLFDSFRRRNKTQQVTQGREAALPGARSLGNQTQ